MIVFAANFVVVDCEVCGLWFACFCGWLYLLVFITWCGVGVFSGFVVFMFLLTVWFVSVVCCRLICCPSVSLVVLFAVVCVCV